MTVFTDPDTVYWISFVLITKAQTAHEFPLPRSACPLRLMRNSSLFASRRRTCSRRLSPALPDQRFLRYA